MADVTFGIDKCFRYLKTKRNTSKLGHFHIKVKSNNPFGRAKLFDDDEIENSIRSTKQGHKCCGGCCDMRRAVIIVNIIALGGRLHGNWV
jgi:hypothetical protein